MQDPCSILRAVEEARALAGLTWSIWEKIHCLYAEAWGNFWLGNLSRARALTERVYDQFIEMGMGDSNYLFGILDLQTDIYLAKTEYLEAKKICDIVTTKASPTGSPFYYAHFLVQKAYIGILTGSPGHDILRNLNAAEDVYRTFGSQRILLCSWVKAELELYQGQVQSACSKFEECLSRSLGIYPDIPILCLGSLGDPRHEMDTAWNTLRWAMI